MYQGHEADTYFARAVMAGVFNRLGDGSATPITCDPPAWIAREAAPDVAAATARAETDMARALFKTFVGQRDDGGTGTGGGT